MIQAFISGFIEALALLFAMTAGMWLEEWSKSGKKAGSDFKIMTALILSVLLAASALGVASR